MSDKKHPLEKRLREYLNEQSEAYLDAILDDLQQENARLREFLYKNIFENKHEPDKLIIEASRAYYLFNLATEALKKGEDDGKI